MKIPTCGLVLMLASAMVAAAAQRTFATPDQAIQALIQASENNDTAALLALLGSGAKAIIDSGDPADDRAGRAEFAKAAHEKVQVENDPSNPDRATFNVGERDWPFPVPLVRANGQWHFDASKGRVEILARRVGRNELTAVQVCRGYVEAQMRYAEKDYDGDGILEYAQHIISTPGKKDGLFWEGESDALVPKAFAEAAAAISPQAGTKRNPYHGYYFRILKAQGPDAPGGAADFVVKGEMIGGFALVAWPAEYGASGIRTFIVSHHGTVYEKDLGANTSALARNMTKFNPDKTWRPVEKE